MTRRKTSHTEAYWNTFIIIAPDSDARVAQIPADRNGIPTIARIEYQLLTSKPYRLNHEQLIYEVHIRKNNFPQPIDALDEAEIKRQLFTKGHACLRASPLTKKFGFGAHYNNDGYIAIYPVDSPEYAAFVENDLVEKIPAMRSSRKG